MPQLFVDVCCLFFLQMSPPYQARSSLQCHLEPLLLGLEVLEELAGPVAHHADVHGQHVGLLRGAGVEGK